MAIHIGILLILEPARIVYYNVGRLYKPLNAPALPLNKFPSQPLPTGLDALRVIL